MSLADQARNAHALDVAAKQRERDIARAAADLRRLKEARSIIVGMGLGEPDSAELRESGASTVLVSIDGHQFRVYVHAPGSKHNTVHLTATPNGSLRSTVGHPVTSLPNLGQTLNGLKPSDYMEKPPT